VTVLETFLALPVAEMARASAFWTTAFGARVSWASDAWTSIHIAGVRIGLATVPGHAGSRTALHLAVDDLPVALGAVLAAGGRTLLAGDEVVEGLVRAEAADTEGNVFTLVERVAR
jgi:predicted enzyme related to lactoylglutathione lyase